MPRDEFGDWFQSYTQEHPNKIFDLLICNSAFEAGYAAAMKKTSELQDLVKWAARMSVRHSPDCEHHRDGGDIKCTQTGEGPCCAHAHFRRSCQRAAGEEVTA